MRLAAVDPVDQCSQIFDCAFVRMCGAGAAGKVHCPRSLRVSGGVSVRGETCGVSGFAPAKLRSVRFRTCEMCEMRNVQFRTSKYAKCEVSGFAPAKCAKCEMSSFALRNMLIECLAADSAIEIATGIAPCLPAS